MTKKHTVTIEQRAAYADREHELYKRFKNGSRDPQAVLDCLQQLLEGDFEPDRPWREENGVIYFSVTSDGTTGEEWIERLEKNGFRIGNYATSVLRSPDFKPTSGVTTEIAVLKGMLFEDRKLITKNIRAEANLRNLTKLNVEVVCLIREKFSDKEIEAMGLWYIVTMHEPIEDSGGDPNLLGADRRDGGCWLSVYYDGPGDRWNRDSGFAFAVLQASS